MTYESYLEALLEAGFTFKLLWEAKEEGEKFAGVRSYVVYAPDGKLLTSIVLRSFKATGSGATPDVAAYFCSENQNMKEDLDDLRGIWSKQIKIEKDLKWLDSMKTS